MLSLLRTNRRWLARPLLCLPTALLSPTTFAEEPPTDDARENSRPRLETTVVTASREQRPWLTTPGAVTSVSADSQLPGLRIDSAELLQGLPGLQVDSRSNYAQDTRLVLRGFGARSAFGVRGMDIRLDNIPLAMPDGQAQLGSVLLDEVASVEVLRGPLAALYGNGAGGVIRLQTRAPEDDQLEVALSAGSHDSYRQQVSGTLEEGPWAMRAQVSHLQSDGYRPHSAVERYQGGAQLYYRGADDLDITLRIDASRDPETQDPSGLSPDMWREDPQQVSSRVETFNTRKKIFHRQISLNAEQEIASGEWQVAVWRGQRNIDQWLPFEGDDSEEDTFASSGAVIDLAREFRGLNASYRHDLRFADTPLSATIGTSLERMEDARRGYVNDFGVSGELKRDETGTVDSDDIYALLEWQPLTPMTVLGGVRHSRSEFAVDDHFPASARNPDDSGQVNFSETSAALGANFKLTEQWAAFTSIGRGFGTPTLTEMAYRNEGTGLNTGLVPSTNFQVEAGVRQSLSERTHWGMTAFRISTDNELVVDQSIGGRTTYHNAGATRRVGLEFAGDWRITDQVSARGSATWLEAEYTEGEFNGNRLPGVAEGQAYALVRWQPWGPDYSLSAASRYRSGVYTSDANQVEAPDYVTFDLAFTGIREWYDTEVEGWIRLENVADETYVGSVIVNQGSGRSFEPAPGRTINAGVRVRL